MKRILILYTSIGLGHKSIAENIGWHLERAGYIVRLEDILEVQSGTLVNVSKSIHSFINRRLPFVWSWLYSLTQYTGVWDVGLRVWLAGRNSQRTKKLITEFNPDLVITTQTTASAIIAHLKRTKFYTKQFAITFSDFHLHQYWLYNAADFYLVNIDEQKQRMIKSGVDANKIFICGMTIKPKPSVDVATVKQKLHVQQNQKVILIASGSLGIGPSVVWYQQLVRQLQSQVSDAKIIIVTGKNDVLHQQLTTTILASNIVVMGFYAPMAELYAISDMFITKPGGLSVTEALQWRVPLFISHWLPGQEELNYTYLQTKQLIMPGSHDPHKVKPEIVVTRVAAELKTGAFRQSLNHNPALLELVNETGESVIKAIKTAFHEV